MDPDARRILLTDDDVRLAEAVPLHLRRAGYVVTLTPAHRIEPDASRPDDLHTERGLGHRFGPAATSAPGGAPSVAAPSAPTPAAPSEPGDR